MWFVTGNYTERRSFDMDSLRERGLVIMSALINFMDYLESQGILTDLSPKTKGKIIKEFLESHSSKRNYFLQAEDIAERLSIPFKNETL